MKAARTCCAAPLMASPPRRLCAVLLMAAVGCVAQGAELSWRRRALRRPAAVTGYIALARLAPDTEPVQASWVCEGEGVELRVDGRRWTVQRDGRTVAEGALPQDCPPSFFAKRTPSKLLLGAAGQWLYSQETDEATNGRAVRLGLPPGQAASTFRLVPRQQVRFADDFPDPEPKPGSWAPVRGRWALSSLSFPSQSANPAELAAVFDELEDTASEGRTRTLTTDIGVRLTGRPPRVWQVAPDSPAAKADIEEADLARAVDGEDAADAEDAMHRLAGEEGTTVRVTVERDGRIRTLELDRALVAWGTVRRVVYLDPCEKDEQAVITVGDEHWTDYRFRCAAHTRGVGAFGLVFAYLEPDDYHVFRWLDADLLREGLGRAELVRVRGGRPTVLAEWKGGFLPHEFYGLSVTVGGDALGEITARGFVDGVPIIEAQDDAIVPGKVGFRAQAPGAVSFDDVMMGEDSSHSEDADGTANIYQRYDRVMRTWANPDYS